MLEQVSLSLNSFSIGNRRACLFLSENSSTVAWTEWNGNSENTWLLVQALKQITCITPFATGSSISQNYHFKNGIGLSSKISEVNGFKVNCFHLTFTQQTKSLAASVLLEYFNREFSYKGTLSDTIENLSGGE